MKKIVTSALLASILIFCVLPTAAFSKITTIEQARLIPDVVEKALPSVVSIVPTKKIRQQAPGMQNPYFNDPFFKHFFKDKQRRAPQRKENLTGMGSGVVVSADGYIITNNHVIHGADKITVILNGEKKYDAKLIGTDPKSDVAVLKIEESNLPFLKFGDSKSLRIAESVLAIGNPFGLGGTVTMGIVSAKGRSIGLADYEDFIQTDADINPGNSGGALINIDGELVGINTAIFSRSGGSQGIGFAIPSNMAKQIMNSLIKHGFVTRGFLGITIKALDDEMKKKTKLNSGVYVEGAMPDSPADKAGIKTGDVITEVNNEKTDSVQKLRNVIASKGPDATVNVVLYRDNKKMKLPVTLTALPSEQTAELGDNSPLDGLTVQDLDKDMLKQLRESQDLKGVIVTDIEPGSLADVAGLKTYDIILQVDRQEIKNKQDFVSKITTSKDDLLLQVRRKGRNVIKVIKK